jgi:hypothetical protein
MVVVSDGKIGMEFYFGESRLQGAELPALIAEGPFGWRYLTCFAEHHKIKDASQFRLRVRTKLAAPSFNGRTADSGSAYRGSNPWGAAKLESMTYDLRIPPKQPTGNKNR